MTLHAGRTTDSSSGGLRPCCSACLAKILRATRSLFLKYLSIASTIRRTRRPRCVPLQFATCAFLMRSQFGGSENKLNDGRASSAGREMLKQLARTEPYGKRN
jgi:hypothetical protein